MNAVARVACRLVFVAGFAATLAGCLPSVSAPTPSASAPSSSTSTASPTATIISPTATPRATAAAGLRMPAPVPAARPSDLVVRHEGVGDTCCPVPWAVLTADGRFVTRTDDNQLRERRLTPAGVQRVRDEIAATGLFERDQVFLLEPRPDATPPARGVGGLLFKAWRGTRTVEVQTAMHQGPDEAYFQPSPARTRLSQLSKQLVNPETWLPADAWADPTPRPYEPAAFALLLRVEPGVYNARPTIDDVSATWPFSVGPLALGEALPPAAGPFAETTRCSALTKDDMRAVRDSIVRAGGSDAMQSSPDGALVVGFGTQDHQSGLVVMMRPLLPDRASCSGEYAL